MWTLGIYIEGVETPLVASFKFEAKATDTQGRVLKAFENAAACDFYDDFGSDFKLFAGFAVTAIELRNVEKFLELQGDMAILQQKAQLRAQQKAMKRTPSLFCT